MNSKLDIKLTTVKQPIELDGRLFYYWKTEGINDYYICSETGEVIVIPNEIKTIGG